MMDLTLSSFCPSYLTSRRNFHTKTWLLISSMVMECRPILPPAFQLLFNCAWNCNHFIYRSLPRNDKKSALLVRVFAAWIHTDEALKNTYPWQRQLGKVTEILAKIWANHGTSVSDCTWFFFQKTWPQKFWLIFRLTTKKPKQDGPTRRLQKRWSASTELWFSDKCHLADRIWSKASRVSQAGQPYWVTRCYKTNLFMFACFFFFLSLYVMMSFWTIDLVSDGCHLELRPVGHWVSPALRAAGLSTCPTSPGGTVQLSTSDRLYAIDIIKTSCLGSISRV